MQKKIALVIPGFQSSPEDWCIPVFTNLARELAAQVELHVYALRYPPRRDHYTIGKVSIHSMGGGAFAGRRLPVASLLNLWRACIDEVAQEHKQSPFAAIMGIWATEAGWLATRAASRCRVPSLVHLAGGELTYIPQIRYGNWQRGLAGLMVKSTLRNANALTVPSSHLRRRLLQIGGIEPGKVIDWAPGVDTAMFSPGPIINNGTVEFITVGSLIPVKGHELLLRGLSAARTMRPNLNVRLRIIGDGRLRPILETLTHDLNLTGYVAFKGELAHDQLSQVYRTADAFLLGSWHEAQCMAVLEAMSCGIPWVGPAVGALADIDLGEATQSGIIFDKREPEAVAQAMLEMIDLAQDGRAKWEARARQRVIERYSMATQAERLLTILDHI